MPDPQRAAAPGAWQLIQRLIAEDPGRPRVTWYGPGGERVELSARTLGNWVAKTANLLADELDVAEGDRVGIDLPAHWRTVVWLLATLAVGAEPVIGEGAGDCDLVVGGGPEADVAVALPALATSFGAPLPDGVVDAATEVRRQPDAYVPADPGAGRGWLAAAGARAAELGLAPGVRLLTGAGTADAPARWLGPLLLGGSVVLHHDVAGLPAERLAALLHQERATVPA